MLEVKPRVYLVGETTIDVPGLTRYLEETGNQEFLETLAEARQAGLKDQEIISSFFAKLCYRSLSLGKNSNLTSTRSIASNIVGTIESGHGSVFEHASFNFMFSNVSRVLTHELVRHRVGTAYSQESGRYCRIEKEGPGMYLPTCIAKDEEAKKIFADTVDFVTTQVHKLYDHYQIDAGNFHTKKELTSAIRRIAPTGLANEIGVTINLRAIRHIISMRTASGAEEEIRIVFNQVADIIKERCPLLLHGAHTEEVNGILEWTFDKKL